MDNDNKIRAENYYKSNENKEALIGLKSIFSKEAYLENLPIEENIIIDDIKGVGHVLHKIEKDIIVFIVNITQILERKGNDINCLNINEGDIPFKVTKRIKINIADTDFL